ncbi:LRR domain containing protein [Parasponia andersonii]|uniref:LRR domain containing protein n=1 Tax=Parasponia andersonii TaxID=3476 RepID=A0A2P5DEE6_PARAD|nr:LRR domain containing protein [Parasponia andersonii]
MTIQDELVFGLSSQIKCLRLHCCNYVSDEGFIETIAKLPLLEELELTLCPFSLEPLEAVGRCCTRSKSLKLNCEAYNLTIEPDEEAQINAESRSPNIDLRRFLNIDLKGDFGKEYPEDYLGCGSFNLEGYPSCFSDFDEYPEDVDFERFGSSSGADSIDYNDSTMLDDDSEGSETISSD